MARMVLYFGTSSIYKDVGVRQLLFAHLLVESGRYWPWTIMNGRSWMGNR